MRAVRSRDTAPEIAVRSMLHRMGYRFRLHAAGLPGKPDIVLPGRHAVLFVHGCFWHGHRCKRGSRQPRTNAAYWRQKILMNRKRDAENRASLRKLGWRVLTAWECELKMPQELAARIRQFLCQHPG